MYLFLIFRQKSSMKKDKNGQTYPWDNNNWCNNKHFNGSNVGREEIIQFQSVK